MSDQNSPVVVYAPASIGNVGVGFDVLGAAIAPIDGALLGDRVQVAASHQDFELHTTGNFVDKLPSDPKENIVYDCWQVFMRELEKKSIKGSPVSMTLEKNMPIGSGLGSSACSIVAALQALNEYHGKPLNEVELLSLMGEMEGKISGSIHYDNVAPCYLGGLQLMVESCGVINQSVPCFDDWYWVMAYPGIKVSTAEARSILPEQYPRHQVIEHGKNLSGFIHACHTGQSELAAALMKDVIAEPYRQSLLPNFSEAREFALGAGALACGISGSGPTLFSICPSLEVAQTVATWLDNHYKQNDEGFVHICQLETNGSTIMETTL